MISEHINSLPLHDWFENWRMQAILAGPRKTHSGHRAGFRTNQMPGEIVPDVPHPGWSLRIPDCAKLPQDATRLFSNGLHLKLGHIRVPGEVLVFTPQPGSLAIITESDIRPALFSAEYELREGENRLWVTTRDQTALLFKHPAGPVNFYALVYGDEGVEDLQKKVEHLVAGDPVERAIKTFSLQHRFLEGSAAFLSQSFIGLHALETLYANLRPPEGGVAYRWVNTRHEEPEGMELNHLYPLVRSWLLLDPEVAKDLVKSALAALDESSGLPLLLTPLPFRDDDPFEVSDRPSRPWPTVCRCVLEIFEATNDLDFVHAIQDALTRYLTGALHIFQPDATRLPTWTSRREAFVVDGFEDRRAPVDLTVMLLRETDALLALAKTSKRKKDLRQVKAARDGFAEQLENGFWDGRNGSYMDRDQDGAFVPWISQSALLALSVPAVPQERKQKLLALLGPGGALEPNHGIPQLDPSRRSDGLRSPLLQHYFVNDALFHTDPSERLDAMAHGWLTVMSQFLAATGQFPEHLYFNTARSRRLPPPAGIQDTAGAMVVLQLIQGYKEHRIHRHAPRMIHWMERHRVAAFWFPFFLFLLLIGFVTWRYIDKAHPPEEEARSLMAMAKLQFREKKYDEATRIFEDLYQRGVNRDTLLPFLGRCHFAKRDYETALNYYERVKEELRTPGIELHRGICMFRLGREEEAKTLYKDLVEKHQDSKPLLAARAQLFLDLNFDYVGDPDLLETEEENPIGLGVKELKKP